MIDINILFCGDDNIKYGILLSCMSLLRCTESQLNIYILTAGIKTQEKEYKPISEDFAKKLQNTLKTKNLENNVKLINISEMFCDYQPVANINTRFTPLCMLRLFADRVKEIPDKILYLDCDVLCLKDFTSFYNQDMMNTEIIGVPDRYGKWFLSRPLWQYNYLNSGVLLLNMKSIRKSGLFEKCRNLCRDKKMFMPDQSALNKLAIKSKAEAIYNCQGRIKENTVFKHFTTFFRFFPYFRSVTVKPWDADKMHSVLKIYEFDNLLNDFEREKQSYE